MSAVLGNGRRLQGMTVLVSAILVIAVMIATARADDATINKTADNVAIKGYDTVAYFTDSKAIEGSAKHEVMWQDARWYFVSEEHRNLFLAAPSRYAPQFGGWCAAGVAAGKYYAPDPEAWAIVDGKLYLNSSRAVADEWQQERAEKIARAEQVWSGQASTN